MKWWPFYQGERFSSYERSLERVEARIEAASARLSTAEKYRSIAANAAFTLGVINALLALTFVVKIKRDSRDVGHMEHLQSLLRVVSVPLGIELSRRFVLFVFDLIIRYSSTQKRHLERTKQAILKELKETSSYERIHQLLLRFDPDVQARARAAARAPSPRTPPTARPRNGQMVPSPPAGVPQPQHPGGGAVFQMFGRAISPMMERFAELIADNPSHEAALRQLMNDRHLLRMEVVHLRHRLSQYERPQLRRTASALVVEDVTPDDRPQQLQIMSGNGEGGDAARHSADGGGPAHVEEPADGDDAQEGSLAGADGSGSAAGGREPSAFAAGAVCDDGGPDAVASAEHAAQTDGLSEDNL